MTHGGFCVTHGGFVTLTWQALFKIEKAHPKMPFSLREIDDPRVRLGPPPTPPNPTPRAPTPHLRSPPSVGRAPCLGSAPWRARGRDGGPGRKGWGGGGAHELSYMRSPISRRVVVDWEAEGGGGGGGG